MAEDKRQVAFEHYLSLGAQRSYRSVAEQFNVSASTVKSWARAGRWRERIQEREMSTAREMADRALSDGIIDREQQRKVIRLALAKLAKAILDGRVRFQGADLDRLIRLSVFLEGGVSGTNYDPTEKDDVVRFFRDIPKLVLEEALKEFRPAAMMPSHVIILPDNGRRGYPNTELQKRVLEG